MVKPENARDGAHAVPIGGRARGRGGEVRRGGGREADNGTGNPLFEVVNRVTKVTVQASVAKATVEAAVHLAGMEQGWSQSLERPAREVAAGGVAGLTGPARYLK